MKARFWRLAEWFLRKLGCALLDASDFARGQMRKARRA
jgi:hypothetical protein